MKDEKAKALLKGTLYTIYEPEFLAMLYCFMRNRKCQALPFGDKHFPRYIVSIDTYAQGPFGTLFFVTFSDSEHIGEDIVSEETLVYEICPVLSDKELEERYSYDYQKPEDHIRATSGE